MKPVSLIKAPQQKDRFTASEAVNNFDDCDGSTKSVAGYHVGQERNRRSFRNVYSRRRSYLPARPRRSGQQRRKLKQKQTWLWAPQKAPDPPTHTPKLGTKTHSK